jgi:hypothetical protein
MDPLVPAENEVNVAEHHGTGKEYSIDPVQQTAMAWKEV